jgi:hypothetical protein
VSERRKSEREEGIEKEKGEGEDKVRRNKWRVRKEERERRD